MKKSNEIQDIFKRLEHGESHELSRKENVWDKLEQKLDKQEKKAKVFPIWRISGIAASFVIAFTSIYFFTKESEEVIMEHNLSPVSKNENVEKKINIDEPKKSTVSDSLKINFNNEKEIIQQPKIFIVNSDKIKLKEEIKLGEIASQPKQNFPTIQGVITDADGFPVSDAEIVVRGGNGITMTDEKGAFGIEAGIGDVLVVTDPLGTSQDYVVHQNDMGKLNFGNSFELEAPVVTGYSPEITQSSMTGAYVVVQNEELIKKSKNADGIESGNVLIKNGYYTTDLYFIEKKTSMTVDQMLAGKISGLNSVGQAGGAPGGVAKVVIRGSSSLNGGYKTPLYVVNGTYMNEKDIQFINPNNIESVEILKEAAATSLYGTRAYNGVVIIKTKGLTKKELRKIKRQNRKNRKNIQETSYIAPAIQPVEVSNEEYSSFIENKFENPAMNPLSTFSVDVDKAAYSNIRRFLNNGQVVPKDAVRIEEMINYFHYDYPQPKDKHPFSINTEYSDAPWNPGHKLLKIGLQGKNLPVENFPNSNLVFLIDVSGSMNDENKLPLLKQSLELLVNNLRENDKVSIVVYAGAAGMVLPPTSGTDKTTIIEALDKLSAGGSTAGASGIELAYQLAQENFITGGNNRVVLATDGDFNVGTSAVGDLETLISEKRKTGIFLTCLGYGMGNYKDNRMEILANKGNGNYAYIDNLQEANKFLVREFSGTLFTIAKDVKIQIEFNPQWIQSYRLIGYETRLLNDEDFVNDAIDAGEIGAGHQVTALYEIIPIDTKSNYTGEIQDLKYSNYNANNSFSNELATVKFRYKKPDGDKSTEIIHPVNSRSIPLKDTSEDFKFATGVAWFGLKLRDSEYIEIKDRQKIIELGKKAMKNDQEGYKAEFLRLVELVK